VSDPNRWKTHNILGTKDPAVIKKEFAISDPGSMEALGQILLELKKINTQLSLLTDTDIPDGDL
jgi:hypothetical protein